ncbi:unnamed protein product, partial [Prorocentrum cordatum]
VLGTEVEPVEPDEKDVERRFKPTAEAPSVTPTSARGDAPTSARAGGAFPATPRSARGPAQTPRTARRTPAE